MANKAYFAAVFSCAAALASAGNAAEGDRISADFDASPNSYFGSVGGKVVLHKDPENISAWLLRADAGYGQFSYSRPGNNINVDMTQEDVMLGYRMFLGQNRNSYVIAYGGADYQDYSLNKTDHLNSLNGDKFGVKGQLYIHTNLDNKTFVDASGGYSSAFDSYNSSLRFGYNLPHCSIGPEVLFTGNEAYDQQRVGAFIENITLMDNVIMAGGVGYSRTDRLIDKDGAYGNISLALYF